MGWRAIAEKQERAEKKKEELAKINMKELPEIQITDPPRPDISTYKIANMNTEPAKVLVPPSNTNDFTHEEQAKINTEELKKMILEGVKDYLAEFQPQDRRSELYQFAYDLLALGGCARCAIREMQQSLQ